MNVGQAYLNGEWVDARELALPIGDLGFVLGAALVERLRTFGGKPFRAEQHLERLRHSLRIMHWNAAELTSEVAAALDEFVIRNVPLIEPGDDWTVTVFLTPGDTSGAARPTVCVHGGPLPFEDWARRYETGVDICVTDIRQVPANCWPPELKCRSRMHYYLADQEADHKCPGARAVLLDQRGFVGEASTANIVAYYKHRGLVTPKLEGVLHGISQQVLFELADELRIPHSEADILPDELVAADEVFTTSTSICIQPVVQQDGRPIGNGRPGPVYRRLLAAWSQAVGVDIARQAREIASRV
jgi:branched-subunit amino acid aminotransferase/4-amino-4-deoxychorismate lyase